MNASFRAAPMPRSLLARLAVLVTVAAGLTGLSSLTADPAHAAVVRQPPGSRAVSVAATSRGAPYVWGAAGPTALRLLRPDQVGLRPRRQDAPAHGPAQQYAATAHVSARSRRVGDLVFFKTRLGDVYHVGIYAGAGRIWHAPKPGDHVKLATLWTSNGLLRPGALTRRSALGTMGACLPPPPPSSSASTWT